MSRKKNLEAPADDAYPRHVQGERCGYTLMADGRIRPAPMYAERFKKHSQERQGINDLMKLFTSHCADLLAEIGNRNQQLWDEITEDYAIDSRVYGMRYDGDLIELVRRPAKESGEAPADPPATA